MDPMKKTPGSNPGAPQQPSTNPAKQEAKGWGGWITGLTDAVTSKLSNIGSAVFDSAAISDRELNQLQDPQHYIGHIPKDSSGNTTRATATAISEMNTIFNEPLDESNPIPLDPEVEVILRAANPANIHSSILELEPLLRYKSHLKESDFRDRITPQLNADKARLEALKAFENRLHPMEAKLSAFAPIKEELQTKIEANTQYLENLTEQIEYEKRLLEKVHTYVVKYSSRQMRSDSAERFGGTQAISYKCKDLLLVSNPGVSTYNLQRLPKGEYELYDDLPFSNNANAMTTLDTVDGFNNWHKYKDYPEHLAAIRESLARYYFVMDAFYLASEKSPHEPLKSRIQESIAAIDQSIRIALRAHREKAAPGDTYQTLLADPDRTEQNWLFKEDDRDGYNKLSATEENTHIHAMGLGPLGQNFNLSRK